MWKDREDITDRDEYINREDASWFAERFTRDTKRKELGARISIEKR
jgi:hypothetical protein